MHVPVEFTGMFPTSWLTNRFGVQSNSLAEQVFILPYVEQAAYYEPAINIPLRDPRIILRWRITRRGIRG